MKTFATTCKLLAALSVVLIASTGCESSGDAHVHGSIYYGVGFYDPWYYGSSYYPPTVVVPPPSSERPDRGPHPSHPIARPTPSPRPTPSIPSMPRPSGRR